MPDLKPDQVRVIADSREQRAFDLSPLRMELGTLVTADYSLAGATDCVAVERKELDDLIGCLTTGRERFSRELDRLRAYEFRAVVIEASWSDMVAGNYRSKMTPQSATASIAAMMARSGVAFHFAGDREQAQAFTRQFLYQAARALYNRVSPILEAMKQVGKSSGGNAA